MKIDSAQWRQVIRSGAADLGVQVEDRHLEQFAIHATALQQWSRRINLTAITDPAIMATKHFVDSLAPVAHIPETASLLDIGSGGGFPGLPLKVLMPSVTLTLVDASRKKAHFQAHVIRRLGAGGGAEALHLRAEAMAQQAAFLGAFDVVISRAMTALDRFVDLASPLLAENGRIIAMKGRTLVEDLAGPDSEQPEAVFLANRFPGFAATVNHYVLPPDAAARTLVILDRRG